MTRKIRIYAVVGPTASGKSRLALELARRHGGEIISCDSMQVYRKMNIGTAKPSPAEMSEIRHHMIDVVGPSEPFSCEDYAEQAARAIEDCAERGKMPIVCGGTGLYLDTLLRGGSSAPSADTAQIRAELCARAEREGAQVLYDELMQKDPESALATHPNNVKRVVRALEILYSSGMKKSELDRLSKETESRYDAKVIRLCYADRQLLYRRIDQRVCEMLAEGLLGETRELMADGVFELNRTAAQAIGYKELIPYLEGRTSLDDAAEELKRATRRYAKRQITWFSAKKDFMELCCDGAEGIKRFEEIVNNAEKLFSL